MGELPLAGIPTPNTTRQSDGLSGLNNVPVHPLIKPICLYCNLEGYLVDIAPI